MRVQSNVATSLADLAAHEGAWRDLEATHPRSVFQRFEPALAFAKAYCEVYEPFVVHVACGSERALAGFVRDRRGVVSGLGEPVLPYVDALATSPDALAALADATAEALGDATLDVAGVRGDSPHLGFWRRVLAAAPEAAALASNGLAHAVLLRPGTSRLFAGHPSARKDIRALEQRFPVRHRTVPVEEHASAVGWILAGPARRHGRAIRHEPLVDARHAQYLRELVAALPPEMVCIRALDVREQPVAMILGLEYRGTWSAHALGLSGELVRYAPATGCLYRTIDWAADRGLVELDLARGDEPYKARWADVRRPLLRVMRGATAIDALRIGAAASNDVVERRPGAERGRRAG